jgi:hypothetical protein
VLVLSPDFCKSEWAALERVSRMWEDRTGFRKKLRPLLLEPCDDLLPHFLRPLSYIDVSNPENFEKNYPIIRSALQGETPDIHKGAYRAVISGTEAIAQGRGAVAAGEKSVTVGTDIHGDLVTIDYDIAFQRIN